MQNSFGRIKIENALLRIGKAGHMAYRVTLGIHAKDRRHKLMLVAGLMLSY